MDAFCEWLDLPTTASATEEGLLRLLRGTSLEYDTEIRGHTAEMFGQEAANFRRTWQRLKEDADALEGPAKKAIEFQARRLCKEFLLKELANRSLIPGSGFPTSVVPFDTLCAETQKAQERNRSEEEGARDRRYECPTRNADIAIREYAPGAEVVVDGLVWKSAGVTLNWLSPIDSGQREPQNLRWAWWCNHCGGAGTLSGPTAYSQIDPEDLERQVAAGDQVELMQGFGQCPVGQFGKRFGSKLKQQMEAAGVWKPGSLVRITYTDRYLNAPLPMLLFLRTCEALSADLKADSPVEVDILVQPLKKDRPPHRIFHDWDYEDDRAEVAEQLGEEFGLDVDLQVKENSDHGRKLKLEYADGQKVLILLDQGFGYWRIAGSPPRHDFRAAPAVQVGELIRSTAAVSGVGESYYALVRI